MSNQVTNPKGTPHPNAEVIKAWADGKLIQFKSVITGKWIDHQGPDDDDPDTMPWDDAPCLWRIKPETKPDVVLYGRVKASEDSYWFDQQQTSSNNLCGNNLKLIFDGESGELKSAEAIGVSP